MFTFQTQNRHGYSVQFSPFYPQRLVCATSQHYGIAGSGRLFILEVEPGLGIQPIRAFDWNNGLFDGAWSENNENVVVTGSGDGSLQVWDVMQPAGPLAVLKEHAKEVYSVDWSQTRHEQYVISGSWDGTIKVWDVDNQRSLTTLVGHEGLVYAALWSPHIPGCAASVSGDHTLRVWDMRTPQAATVTVPAHNCEILTCDWAKYDQNLVFTGAVDGTIRGWDIRMGGAVIELTGHELAVRRIRTSPHAGNILASASYDFTVRIWDVKCGQSLETVEHHSEFVYGLDFNLHIPGQLADSGWDELVRVFSLSSCLPQGPP